MGMRYIVAMKRVPGRQQETQQVDAEEVVVADGVVRFLGWRIGDDDSPRQELAGFNISEIEGYWQTRY